MDLVLVDDFVFVYCEDSLVSWSPFAARNQIGDGANECQSNWKQITFGEMKTQIAYSLTEFEAHEKMLNDIFIAVVCVGLVVAFALGWIAGHQR
jgi:hypothetical protein